MKPRWSCWMLSLVLGVVCGPPSRGADLSEQDRIVAALRDRLGRGALQARAEAAEALRRLKDPELRPLFGQLASSEQPQLRRHGLLGLAEIEAPPAINVSLVLKLKAPAERSLILGEALALGLVGDAQIRELLGAPGLDPYVEVVLRSRLAAAGGALDGARMEALTGSPALTIRCTALLTRAQFEDPAAADAAAEALLAAPRPGRDREAQLVLEHVWREKLTKATGFVERVLADYKDDVTMQADVLRVWMSLDAKGGAGTWSDLFSRTTDFAGRIRLAMLALDHARDLPPELFEPLAAPGGHAVLVAIGRAGRALSLRADETESLVALARADSPPATLWLAQRAKDVAPGSAGAAWKAVVEAAAARPSRKQAIDEGAVLASEALALNGERGWIGLQLESAAKRGDEPLTHGLLAGLLRAGGPVAWDPAAPPKWPDRMSEGLAVLCEARANPSYGADPGRLGRLQEVATGFLRVPEVFRTQAMWLALERSMEPRLAVGLVVAGGLGP